MTHHITCFLLCLLATLNILSITEVTITLCFHPHPIIFHNSNERPNIHITV